MKTKQLSIADQHALLEHVIAISPSESKVYTLARRIETLIESEDDLDDEKLRDILSRMLLYRVVEDPSLTNTMRVTDMVARLRGLYSISKTGPRQPAFQMSEFTTFVNATKNELRVLSVENDSKAL